LGNPVRLVSFELDHRILCEARLIGLFGVSLDFRERGVTEYRHDHFRGRASFREPPARCLAQAVWLTIERQAGVGDPVAKPLTETVDREGLAGYDDVNDAERLRHDPAMRWIVGGKAAHGSAASPSQMGRFETRRRVVALHGVLSFFFNLTILALTVNMISNII
jgi:hypothetical protein